MKSKTIGTLFVVLAMAIGLVTFAPSAFAQSTASVTIAKGASSQGCETTNSCFQPYNVQVAVGGTVTWTNTDTSSHTVTSGLKTDNQTGTVFTSGDNPIKPGQTFSFTFANAGTYNYFCIIHPWMAGIVTVAATNTTTGNNTVPEFGSIAPIILVIAVISIIAITAKTRGIPKF